MIRHLCKGLPAEWWQPENAGARLAMAICRRCPAQVTCPAGDPEPYGVIRAGAPFSNAGTLLNDCPTCGYPQTGNAMNRVDQCPRCELPSLGRWRSDIERWAGEGLNDREIGARLGASARDVRNARRHWTKTIAPVVEIGSVRPNPTPERKAA